jgi:hypothetical protein
MISYSLLRPTCSIEAFVRAGTKNSNVIYPAYALNNRISSSEPLANFEEKESFELIDQILPSHKSLALTSASITYSTVHIIIVVYDSSWTRTASLTVVACSRKSYI